MAILKVYMQSCIVEILIHYYLLITSKMMLVLTKLQRDEVSLRFEKINSVQEKSFNLLLRYEYCAWGIAFHGLGTTFAEKS
jgi:hypothetical protein